MTLRAFAHADWIPFILPCHNINNKKNRWKTFWHLIFPMATHRYWLPHMYLTGFQYISVPQQQVKVQNPFSDVVLLLDLCSITILKSSEIFWIKDVDAMILDKWLLLSLKFYHCFILNIILQLRWVWGRLWGEARRLLAKWKKNSRFSSIFYEKKSRDVISLQILFKNPSPILWQVPVLI